MKRSKLAAIYFDTKISGKDIEGSLTKLEQKKYKDFVIKMGYKIHNVYMDFNSLAEDAKKREFRNVFALSKSKDGYKLGKILVDKFDKRGIDVGLLASSVGSLS